MAEWRYRLEPCEHAAYSNIRRADGTLVGGLSFHTQEGAPAVVEMNSLVDQLEEARAEAERLRDLLRPIAEVFASWARERFSLRRDEETWAEGFSEDDGCVKVAHMRQCCAALGIEVTAP